MDTLTHDAVVARGHVPGGTSGKPPLRRVRGDATAEQVGRARRAAVSVAGDAGASEARCGDVALAVSEALSNAVLHAFVDGVPGTVTMTCHASDGRLVIEVCDDGTGMRPRPDSPGLGLGLPLIANCADKVDVEDAPSGRGTLVRMTFELHRAS
jgi:serine/threonine-protein kinase RsbW